jgi:hypothetical protein
MQNPNKLLVLAPKHFAFNNETAINNHFQNKDTQQTDIKQKAIEEHHELTKLLNSEDIDFAVIEDLTHCKNPDALFLNNWFSVQPDNSLVIYPMWAKNRRSEVHPNQITQLKNLVKPTKIIDYSNAYKDNQFCEGTGSIIFDHEKKMIFASISERTTPSLLAKIGNELGYEHFTFEAVDRNGNAIYHTNVLLSIGEHIVVLCGDAVENLIERKMLEKTLTKNGKIIINISFQQMNKFCANVLEVNDRKGNPVLLMSETAFLHFSDKQKEIMRKKVRIAYCSIPTIEYYGGGSLRCMLARG